MPFKDPEKQKAYQREWVAKRRAKFFAGKSCKVCGGTSNLELDHIDPTKKIDHVIWSWSESRRNAELVKCQILCSKCHRSKSVKEMPKTMGVTPYSHGTYSMYNTHGCRCKECVKWSKSDNRRRRPL